MAKSKTLITLSIFLILLPFLGFPISWDRFFVASIGVVSGLLGVSYYRKEKEKMRRQNRKSVATDTPIFMENKLAGSPYFNKNDSYSPYGKGLSKEGVNDMTNQKVRNAETTETN
ncbi:MAG: hypothetical protein Q8P86_01495 [bacterium]|nr:hypothetical protein [bacterium]